MPKACPSARWPLNPTSHTPAHSPDLAPAGLIRVAEEKSMAGNGQQQKGRGVKNYNVKLHSFNPPHVREQKQKKSTHFRLHDGRISGGNIYDLHSRRVGGVGGVSEFSKGKFSGTGKWL